MAKKEKNQTQYYDITLNILFAIVSEPYFLFHFLTFFSYFSIRICTSHLFDPEFSAHLIHREFQALVAFVTLGVVKVVREETWEGFVTFMLLFANIQNSVSSYHTDPAELLHARNAHFLRHNTHPPTYPPTTQVHGYFGRVIKHYNIFIHTANFVRKYRQCYGVLDCKQVGLVFPPQLFLVGIALTVDMNLGIWFMLTFLVINTFTQQPAYMGLGAVTQLTPLQLETLLTEGGTSRFWLVEFRSLVSTTCIRTSRTLPELSITFANKHISFGVVDLGLFPNTAERFGISLGKPDQLPTFILFENNEEVTRFPEINSTSYAEDITKKRLCRHFELDKHLLDYISGK